MLADVLRAQADWRSLEAIRQPDELRHARAEAALTALAEYVESNPTDALPETLNRLEGQVARYETRQGYPDLGKFATAYLRRYGFEFEADDLAAVLDELAECALKDARRDQARR